MGRLRHTWPALAIALVLCGPAQRCHADDAAGPTPEQLTQARVVFAEGLDLVEQERWAEAEVRFRLVLEVRSSAVVSYNLASTLVHQLRLVEAAEVLRGIVRDEDADGESRVAAEQLLAEVEPRIGSLTVRLAGNTEGAELIIDERAVELTSSVQALSVDPGPHSVVLKRAGEVVASEYVQIGDTAPLHAELQLEIPGGADLRVAERAAQLDKKPEPRVAPVPRLAETRERDGSVLSSWWFWTGAGVLVAGGVAAAAVLTPGQTADPIGGNTDPPVLRGRVQMGMP